jgi:hypothetical protein
MQNLHLAFDVGHSSIGWAVLESRIDHDPDLLGCGSVIFQADDCLASQRRGFRRQRRHIRATRMRIERMKRLLAHTGVLTREQLDTPGCAWPWLLAARVLRGAQKLTWAELWDVLRWYAHNRGYDGNKGWTRHESAADAEDTEKEAKAHELLDAFAKKHGRPGTMAEVFCDRLGIDPLKSTKASTIRFRDLGAAFPREGVEAEVERILRAQSVEEKVITALMRDHTAVVGADFHLPARYGQRVNGTRTPGGLLFGQLVPRFENRIIATCPITFQRVHDRILAEGGDEERAVHEAEKLAKVPGIGCVEFYRFRWAMQLANVSVAIPGPKKSRRLFVAERKAVNALIEQQGALTPGEFRKAVRAETKTDKDNLDQLLALPDADKSLIIDPARKTAMSGVLGVLWPLLDAATQKHTLTNLRRGKAVTVRSLLASCPAATAAFDKWWDGEAMKMPRATKRNPAPEAKTRDTVLGEKHDLAPVNGRAAYTREVMREVHDFVLRTNGHPMDGTDGASGNGPLFRSEAIRHAQLQRAIDEQTNNHLVRHRLRLLGRLHGDLIAEYAGGDKARIARITIEVNRSVKELSGKTAKEQATEQTAQTRDFRDVERRLNAAYEGMGVRLTAGLIRKGRIAQDLGWTCPYTGRVYDELQLLRRTMDKDHIIPRSQRASDSLDSLVITTPEINREKDNRTGLEFVRLMNQPENLKRRDELGVWTPTQYEAFVKALDTRGHDDDMRRKKNRKRLMMIETYVEKEFTPGDLTKTSQLVRLAAQALGREYLGAKKPPVVTSLPGSVTGAARKSWNLTGCLVQANANILNPDDLDDNGKPRVHRKTEIRGITHLHHALDASVLAFISHSLPRDGGAWKKEVLELLAKRKCNAQEQAMLRALLRGNVTFTPEGAPQLAELAGTLRQQLCERLAERRVVQHLPADMSGLASDQTVWRVFDPEDRHENAVRLGRWLREAGIEIPAADAPTVIIITRKRKAAPVGGVEQAAGGKTFHEGKTWRWVYEVKAKDALLGFAPSGDPAKSKLKPYKAVKVLGDNFGIALDPEPTLIRPLHVWRQLQELRAKLGGKWPRVIRKGTLIRIERAKSEKVNYKGVWMVRGVTLNQRAGFLFDLSPTDQITYRGAKGSFSNVSVRTLRACGLTILRCPLPGIAAMPPGALA